MLRRPIIGDGNCLFRSVATSFIHVFFGLHLGNGGRGMRTRDRLSNAAATWLRYMVAHLLYGGEKAVREAERRQRRTLPHALFEIGRELLRSGEDRASEASIEHYKVAEPETLVGEMREDVAIGGVPVPVAIEDQDQRSYCEEMARCGTWGGELEVAALFALLRLPIAVYDEKGSLMVRHGPSIPARISIVWCAGGHYDALLERSQEALLDLSSSS